MFSKGNSSNSDSFDTIIGINSKIEGNIETEGTIRVDGKVFGDLKINGDVYVGKDAAILGNIYANNVFISGKVEGNIESKGILKVHSSGKLYGDIAVYSLVTEEGSLFEGKCKMMAVNQPEDVPSVSNTKKSKNNNKTSAAE
ncbi:bactofilin family protein [Acetivibrio cellulolyticus]|uniref:bactofilin family protein n=1 Tax=Acetivibrio cellulolyticus TaxID=35830 RepID=UPI0001E2E2F5|nr:polymer-forming cytoskeletal protein [Acetivibrio cellulolyticus]